MALRLKYSQEKEVIMKISFQPGEAAEAVPQYKGRQTIGKSEKASNAYQVSFRTESDTGLFPGGKNVREKGRTMLELQQEASNTDVGIQQDYMTVASHTMSKEDYAKLEEEGFHFASLNPEEAVTIVDKIKAELVRSGQSIRGYTDDIDMDTLAQALGSDTLARAVSDAFKQADIPLTEDNLDAVRTAWSMAASLKEPGEGATEYMVDNELPPEIWNLYLAQNSGAQNGTGGQPRYYAGEVEGYYIESARNENNGELSEQIDSIIQKAKLPVNEETRQAANWLLEKGLPLTDENLRLMDELKSVEYPIGEDTFAMAAAVALTEGREPVHGNLAETENIYEKAEALLKEYGESMEVSDPRNALEARKVLEEIRLRMTAEVNVKLLKSGFSIDTEPMEQLLEALKEAQRQVAESLFPGDSNSVEKYQEYNLTNRVIEELPETPAWILGSYSAKAATATLYEFHAEAVQLQKDLDRAAASYETLMTAPRRDMGDSIQKAFANVDDILQDMALPLTEENQRAVRILGYNSMEITARSIAAVKEADAQVQSIVEKMTPAATLQMIRDGINPLEKTFTELEEYFAALPEEYSESAESYSRFLYRMEQTEEITPEERESYIGIYRLLHKIAKGDGAAVGALVNTHAQLQFSNLLTAVRNGRFKGMDAKISDEVGVLTDLVREGRTIPEQIAEGFIEHVNNTLTDVSYNQEADAGYRNLQMDEIREAMKVDADSTALLERSRIPGNTANLLAAQALIHDGASPFRAYRRIREWAEAEKVSSPEALTSMSETENATENEVRNIADKLWESLEDHETFAGAYQETMGELSHELEHYSLEQADRSMDVRGLHLLHKQISIATALSHSEEYILPMYIGDELSKVHLTVQKGTEKKAGIHITVDFGENMHCEASLQLAKGEISGVLVGNAGEEVMKLQSTADIFSEMLREENEDWTLGELSIVNSRSTAAAFESPLRGSNEETADGVDTPSLYRIAKLFLQAMKQ